MSVKAKNGDILHTANLDGAGYNPVTMLHSSAHDTLFVGISGETRAYRPDGLKKLWKSKLPGMVETKLSVLIAKGIFFRPQFPSTRRTFTHWDEWESLCTRCK